MKSRLFNDIPIEQKKLNEILYVNQNLASEELKYTQSWTRKLIEEAQAMGGNYYLPYQSFTSKKQFRIVKQHYDPMGLFSNQFYQHYFSNN